MPVIPCFASDTRSQKDTLAVFGGEYPGGALYTRSDWIAKHEKETQGLANAIVATLKWIAGHSPEEIMGKMPDELVGGDKALYLAALKNTLPMYSATGRMDPKGAQAVLAVFSQSVPEIAKAKIDLSKTYTNRFVDQANARTGMLSRCASLMAMSSLLVSITNRRSGKPPISLMPPSERSSLSRSRCMVRRSFLV